MVFFIISLMLFNTSMFLLMNKINYCMEWNVLILNSINLNMFLYFDWMMMMFMFTVLLISSVIMLYCCEYMSHDNYNIRFFYLMFLFITSMLIMISSPNIVSILIGWDGLGLVSYCLVIYYNNINSYNSGMLTVLLNRIGDITILVSISMFMVLGSWNFMFINKVNMLILLMIMISAFTKSAQFPFSSWLPAAMAAPTPVSSLVHSSTLVTAGIYMLIRFHYIIYLNKMILKLIMLISLITMLMAGFSANFEYDMKKIIAFSTLSQLGLMMMIFSFKNWELAYLHLIIHAMFKSMMFMCSGILIHSMMNYQDIRFLGMLKFYMPMTFSMLMISNLSLCGMPFMSGFYSKDQILEIMLLMNNNLMIYLLLLLSTGLTVMYSMRLIFYLMFNTLNMNSINMIKEFKLMSYPMISLMMMSIIFGNFLNLVIFNNIENIFLLLEEKMSIILICIMFIIINKMMIKLNNFKLMYFFKNFNGKMWFLYNFIPIFILMPLKFSKLYSNNYDKGWSEMLFKNTFIMFNNENNKIYKFYNNNNIMLMLFSTNIIMIIMMLML
nr:NADH dehydrogenase subunit 5 [Pteromalus puparum]AYM35231.1 NADH dehydrogenase subunit 5 [Pteromalus puparum]